MKIDIFRTAAEGIEEGRGQLEELTLSRAGLRGGTDGCWQAPGDRATKGTTSPAQTMSAEQLSSLLSRLKEEPVLQEKFRAASDLDTAVTMARDAGFDVTKEDWLNLRATQRAKNNALSDDELGEVTGGRTSSGSRWEEEQVIQLIFIGSGLDEAVGLKTYRYL